MCSTMMSIAIVTMKAALMFYRRVAKIVRWIDRFVVLEDAVSSYKPNCLENIHYESES